MLVDSLATGAIALLAGADTGSAARLAAAMFGLQAGIGAVNDVVDAPRDAGLKPGKPIPAGLVRTSEATFLAVLGGLIGMLLALPSGTPTLLIGVTILAVGLAYDLRLKGTAWSWLPFAVGIPLLPVFAWLGSGSPLPGTFVLLLPAGFAAGAALAIGNGLADVERDAAAGVSSVAVRLGRKRAWRLHAALHGAVLVTAVGGGAILGIPAVVLVGAVVPATALGVGVALAGAASPARRERGWELQVIGVALLAAGWLAGTVVR